MFATSKYTPFITLSKAREHFCNGEFGYRFGFNGQEKDDEIAGVGNIMTAEFWMYDGRLGRRWNVDPVIKYHESPYSAYSNNPIWFVDPNGADTGDVVIAFGGGDFYDNKDKGDVAPDIVKQIQEQNFNQNGGKAQAFHSQYWGTSPDNLAELDKATQEAYDFVIQNYNKDEKGNTVSGGKIMLYGYSYGGVMASHLATRLQSVGLSVDMLFSIDAAAGPESENVNRSISSNVKINVNIYQTKSSGIFGLVPGSYGGANTAKNPYRTTVNNLQLKAVEHGGIDNFTKKTVINLMLYTLNSK